MNSITQDMKFRQSLMKYAEKYGVSRASRKYNKTRSYIYFWKSRWDGSVESLATQSRKPHHHPNEHTEAEIKLIKDHRRRCPDLELPELWHRLRKKGYSRCITSLQIDVKVVPRKCIADKELKLYQYTAIDEYTRLRFLYGYEEQSTYSSSDFAERAVKWFKKHGITVECIQTDNGFEFTNRFSPSKKDKKTMFENKLADLGIKHKLIRPYTPRHNGKVERSHREDHNKFYSCHSFFSCADLNAQLTVRSNRTNNRPMRPLKWLSPIEFFHAHCTI